MAAHFMNTGTLIFGKALARVSQEVGKCFASRGKSFDLPNTCETLAIYLPSTCEGVCNVGSEV